MPFDAPIPEMSVVELKRRLDGGNIPFVLDVREPQEVSIASLPTTANTVNIPLGELLERLSDLEPESENDIVVVCRSGMRSEMVTNYLMNHGFNSVFNLKGGILAWSREIDPSVPQY